MPARTPIYLRRWKYKAQTNRKFRNDTVRRAHPRHRAAQPTAHTRLFVARANSPPSALTAAVESFKRRRRRPSARQAAQRAVRGARVAVSRTYDDRHHRGRARLPQLDARSSAGSGRCRHSDAVVRARARDTRLRPRPQVPGSPRGASGSTWKGRAVGSDGTRRILQHPSPSCHAHMLTRARVPRPLLIAGPGASAAATAAMAATAARVAVSGRNS